ncbi:MAG: site-specific DNA-methyltransferase, partial [Pseudomonadota bacterium]|nr:site-specific DNA-methyltransferase [Pseudomonadota bacterium]
MSAPLSQTNNPIILEKLFARIQQEGGVMLQSKMEGFSVPILTHSFWTSRQRQASSLHEVSYRACFKPQLPAFFIEALSEIGQSVYDPFSGRGTTPIEAALRCRHIVANDINPLSPILYRPRLFPPVLEELEIRLNHIKWDNSLKAELDLSMFYHEKTLRELLSLRCYLQEKKALNQEDHVDQWIRMVASNRLSGHSPGFFSVYSLPPNQAVLPERQRKINRERNQTPTYRPVAELILKKSRQLLRDVNEQVRRILAQASDDALILCGNATATPQ